jgi:hypothetical protein
MSTNSSIIFIGIPHSNPSLDNTFRSFLQEKMPYTHLEPILFFDGKNIPQWNFTKAYFIDVAPNYPMFNLLVSQFSVNGGSDLDGILLGFNTREYYMNMFETLLE